MPVDFFEATCQDKTNSPVFGLCDDEDIYPAETPAYIDESDPDKWIAQVNNPSEIDITFTAIDHCIQGMLKPDGGKDSKCDCMLSWTDSVMFVELKTGQQGGWVAKGTSQLKTTIDYFKANNAIAAYPKRRACVANSQRPLFSNSYKTIIQQFKDETDFNLSIQREINIP